VSPDAVDQILAIVFKAGRWRRARGEYRGHPDRPVAAEHPEGQGAVFAGVALHGVPVRVAAVFEISGIAATGGKVEPIRGSPSDPLGRKAAGNALGTQRPDAVDHERAGVMNAAGEMARVPHLLFGRVMAGAPRHWKSVYRLRNQPQCTRGRAPCCPNQGA